MVYEIKISTKPCDINWAQSALWWLRGLSFWTLPFTFSGALTYAVSGGTQSLPSFPSWFTAFLIVSPVVFVWMIIPVLILSMALKDLEPMEFWDYDY